MILMRVSYQTVSRKLWVVIKRNSKRFTLNPNKSTQMRYIRLCGHGSTVHVVHSSDNVFELRVAHVMRVARRVPKVKFPKGDTPFDPPSLFFKKSFRLIIERAVSRRRHGQSATHETPKTFQTLLGDSF